MSDEALVRLEPADGWATVVLNRPDRRNAITGPMADQLADAIDEVSADVNVSAVVLRGEGGAFCSGVDLTELQAVPQHPWVAQFQASVRRAHIALYNCACPIVVALERYGINAGTALAVSGDLIVAGETSFLQIGEIQQGVGIPMNVAWMRLKTTETVLSRMALYGDRVPGPELLRLGVVNEVVADDAVRGRAEELAARLAGFPAESSRRIKADIRSKAGIDPRTWFPERSSPALLSAAQVRS